MSEELFKELESYKKKNKLSNLALTNKLEVPANYYYRWRKVGAINGRAYRRIIEDFLKKEKKNGKF